MHLLGLALLALPGCGYRDCATPTEGGREGQLYALELNGSLEAVETGRRHIADIITYAWFELEAVCLAEGELSDIGHEFAYPLMPSPDLPDLWGGWREYEAEVDALTLGWSDGQSACFNTSADGGCEGWVEGEIEVVGPWLSAQEWYAQIWWPLINDIDLPGG